MNGQQPTTEAAIGQSELTAGLAAREHGDSGGWCETHKKTGTWCATCKQYTYRCCSEYGTCQCS